MAEYIDINELLTVINSNVAQKDKERCVQLLDAILDAPTADVVEVRHGEWKICSDGYYPYCSRCRYEPEISTRYSNNLTPYCPNCGAKMDGERKERG